MLLGVALIALGLVLALLSVLAWTGRWRRWTGQVILGPLPAPITLFPAMAVWFPVLGLGLAGAISSSSPLAGAALLALIAGIVLYLWAPPWWGPRWYRELERPVKPDLSDPLTATVVGATSPRRRSRARGSGAPFGGSRPLKSWTGSWIAGDETGERQHALARPGVVEGRLAMYAEGLAFGQKAMVAALEEEPPEPPVIPWERVSGARVVPRGAGPDGRRRRSSGLRSIFPRLVIDTDEGPYLFEVQRARRTARELQDALEERSAVADRA